MATLAEIKQKNENIKPQKILSAADIRSRVKQDGQKARTRGNQFTQDKPTSFLGKARDFTTSLLGGGALARGIGQSLAAGGVLGTQEEETQQTADLANRILDRIRAKRERGEDTSRLEAALEDAQSELGAQSDAAQDFGESLVSNKQVIGSGARLAALAGGGALTSGITRGGLSASGRFAGRGAGRFGGLSQLFGTQNARTFAGGALRGAGVGATAGALEGGAQTAGFAAERDKSTEEIINQGLLGAGLGFATGGVLGTVAGSISGVRQGKKVAEETFAETLAAPKETQKVRAQAIQEGRFEDPGLFRRAQITESRRDKDLGEAIKDVVSPKATLSQNIDAIRDKVSFINRGVKSYIQKNRVPFNTRQLRSKLEKAKDENKLIFASDTTAERTYDAVVDAFMKHVRKMDTEGLFEARQNFDNIPAIQKLLQSQGLGENVKKEIVLSVRRAANEYIAEQLPKGNNFRDSLMREHRMLEALGNLADKSAKIVGKNKVQLINEEYPLLKWVIGSLLAGGLSGGVAAGGTFVGSSD